MKQVIFGAVLAMSASPVVAQADPYPPFPEEPQLAGVNRAEAEAIVAQLERAQASLRAGGKPPFDLLSGAPSYYASANIGPRDAFLALDFDKTLWVYEADKGNFTRAYRLEVLPDGFGGLVWDVRVWLRTSGDFERIELLNRPPNPF